MHSELHALCLHTVPTTMEPSYTCTHACIIRKENDKYDGDILVIAIQFNSSYDCQSYDSRGALFFSEVFFEGGLYNIEVRAQLE